MWSWQGNIHQGGEGGFRGLWLTVPAEFTMSFASYIIYVGVMLFARADKISEGYFSS